MNSGKIVGDPLTALSPLGLVCDPCSGVPRGFSPAKNLFAPRLGFAYDVFGDGKMALRSGFGIFHERLRQNNFNFGAGGSWPNSSNASALYGNVANIDTSVTAGTPQITPPGLTVWPEDNTMPSIYSWYVGVQRELPGEVRAGRFLFRQPCNPPDGPAKGERRAGGHFCDEPEPAPVGQFQGRRPPPVLRLGQLECRRNTRLLTL